MELSSFIAPLISGAVTALISGFSVYVVLEKNIAIIQTQIKSLKEAQDKHNSIIERTYKLEEQVKYIQHQIDKNE